LTRAIKQLEDELGGELIRREGRLSHLTNLGNQMQPLLQQCFEAALAAKSIAAKVKKGEVPSLALAVSRTLDLDYLMQPLSEMHRCFSGFQLKLRRGTGAQIAAMLKAGEVDLAIGGPMGESWDRLETWPMFSEAFDLVVGIDHPLAMRNDLDLDVELVRDLRFLIHAGTDIAEFETARLNAAGICLDHAHEVDSDRDLEALVVAEFGLAIMPASAMNSQRVRHIACSGLDLRRTVAIYAVAGRARSREASALLNLVRSADWSHGLAAGPLEDA
jgi:DNA-binding transcriptional LysR family regulator